MPTKTLTAKVVEKQSPPSDGAKYLELWDTLLPGFGLRIGHGGKRSFVVMTRISGRQRRFTIGSYPSLSLADARERARELLQSAQIGLDPKEFELRRARDSRRQRRLTFGSVSADYMRDHGSSLRWGHEVQRMITVDLLPHWESVPISEITRQDVKDMLAAKANSAPIAANRLLSVIRQIFNYALDEELVEHSPTARVRAPARNPERERVLSDEEIRAIWEATETIGYPIGPFVRVLFLTAQRLREVSRMEWEDISIESAAWTLPGAKSKSGRGHLVPLSPTAIETLRALPCLGSFVFSSRRVGDKPINGFSKAKCRVDELSGVTDWHFHDIRRTVASRLASMSGIDRLVISKVLNHAESGVTKVYDRYSYDREKQLAMDRWSSELGLILSKVGQEQSGN